MTPEERIKRFMSLMTEATQETGITVAVEHGAIYRIRSRSTLKSQSEPKWSERTA